MYDVIILGGGPAGLTAALYCGRQQLKTLLLTKDIGGQTSLSHLMENYPGVPAVTGLVLAQKMLEQVKGLPSVEVKIAAKAQAIKQLVAGLLVQLIDQQEYTAKAVIVAAGKQPRQLNVPGENDFYGKGVTYCATCDGPLFKNKAVVVVGGGNSGLAAALQLAAYCPQVYLVEALPSLRGEKVRQEKVLSTKNITVLTAATIKKIVGDKTVEGVVLEQAGQERILAAAGVFVEVGYMPATDFIKDLIALNQTGEIKINNKNETSVKGIFAAGDITETPYKQTVIAAGEGAKAAMSAAEFVLGRLAAW